MKSTWHKIIIESIKKIFIVLLSGLGNESNYTKCLWSSNQKCMIQPALINLHPNEYSQEFHYYPFLVKLDRFPGSWNIINELSNKAYPANTYSRHLEDVFSVTIFRLPRNLEDVFKTCLQ